MIFLIVQIDNYAQKVADSDLLKIFGYTLNDEQGGLLCSGVDSTTLVHVKRYLGGERLRGNNGLNPSEPSEVLILTKSERQYLDSQLIAAKDYRWTKVAIEKCGIFRLRIGGEDCLAKRHRIQQHVYEVMQPIFIRDSTICFTYHYISCMGLCGTGEILIHRKVKGKWTAWISIARFDS